MGTGRDGRPDSLSPVDGVQPLVRPTRVVVVEPQAVLAEAVQAALGEHGDVSIVAVVGSVAAAVPLAREVGPDVVVVDTGNVSAEDVRSLGDLLDAGVTAALVALASVAVAAADEPRSVPVVDGTDADDLIRAVRRAARRRAT
jgi:DNA-binding NarL/FixJ family response regulator